MCDKLVFDLSQEVEGTPNVFIRKDWINIIDNMNQNYASNQSIIDTSQLSNSNKWMSYREAYMAIPLTLNMVTPVNIATTGQDYCIGLKNWFGSIIHSFTVDYNGTTVIQQTPFVNMWNSFKLLTSLSLQDIETQGSTIGFFPDTPDSECFFAAAGVDGIGLCNNVNSPATYYGGARAGDGSGSSFVAATGLGGNTGLQRRIININFDPTTLSAVGAGAFDTYMITANNCNSFWRGYITVSDGATAGVASLKQIAVVAIVYLKHVHSFFNMIPLLKGVFMKMTMNLNNSDCVMTVAAGSQTLTSSSVPVGGVQTLMIPSRQGGFPFTTFTAGAYSFSLSVGRRNLSALVSTAAATRPGGVPDSLLSMGSVYLYVPAYTFNPTFEQAYLSSSPKMVRYSDVYQYSVQTVGIGENFNTLITNGIAGIKSVLVIPFYAGSATALPNNYNQWLSPFDPAGCGTTAIGVPLSNFNIQISGQNAIYNMQRYSFEEFVNQLYGQNAVNGGLTDGLTSGLIDFQAHKSSYSYYYVNVERMLPVEKTVPKSVQLIGTNLSPKALTFIVFVEYEAEIKIDLYTGARI